MAAYSGSVVIMNQRLPRLPLGLSDFATLREAGQNYLYVDKTQALLRLLDAGKYLFLARPRRFGKSLLCSTLKYLYEGRRELFAGLAIEPVWDWSKTNPVVHLSLTATDSSSAQSLRESLLTLLASHAKPYDVTLTGRRLPDDFAALLAGIHAKTGRRVVVIVDEYEKPVHDHIAHPDKARAMREALSQFYGSLKGCDAQLEKLFITGIGRMVKTSIFSELNQMKDVTLLPEAAEVCGYTEPELHRSFAPFITGLARRNDMTVDQAWLTLRERYNGYWWGDGEKVYNPWAILNCLDTGRFNNYWWASGTPGMLVDMAATLNRPDGDLEGIKATDISLLFDIADPAAEPLLWQSGYLTVKAVHGPVYTLGFPNAEVREAWFGMMLGHFCKTKHATGQTAATLVLDAFRTRNQPQFTEALTALFAAIPYDLHQQSEAYYHSIFYAALKAVGGEILAEPHSDKGRADAVVKTPEAIFVVEFKLGTAEEALAQLKAKRYHEPYLSDPRPIVLVAAGGFRERAVTALWETVKG
jgi:hypothetical protein